jgi:hypothetical protein
MREARLARILGIALFATVLTSSFATAQSADPPSARPSSTYFVVTGAPDESVQLSFRLNCNADPQTVEEPPPFGAGLRMLVFEPGTETPALAPYSVTLGETQGRAEATVPLAGFAGPAVIAFDDVDVRGPCEISVAGRVFEAATGRTRAAIRPLGDRVVVEPGDPDDESPAWVGHGADAFFEEMQSVVLPAVCNQGTIRGPELASFRLVAAEPSGYIAPQIIDVSLGDDAAIPLPNGRILLAQEVQVPYAPFCPSAGACSVDLSIVDVETAPGCRLLTPVVRRADAASGRTIGMVFQSYALYPH